MPYQPRESLSDSLAAADVHWVSLLPAMEGLIVPSKFYGILAAARPVVFIGDPDGELARHIGRSRGGAVVQVGATMQLAKALSDLQEDRARCQRMGEWGYQYYCARFSAQRAFQEWVGVLTPQSRPADALPPAFSNR
jgi:glycosyltransferase involved in cell wall biosynthesis